MNTEKRTGLDNIILAKEIFDKVFHNIEDIKLEDCITNLNKSDALETLSILNKLYINIIVNPETFTYDDFDQRRLNAMRSNYNLQEIAKILTLSKEDFRNFQLDRLNI